MRPLALRWLQVLHIAICWVPALYYSITLTPNNSILHYKGYKRSNQIGSRITTPELSPSPTYRPVLAPYTGSHNSGLHLKNYRLEVDLQPQTFYSPTHLKDSKLEVELQPLHWLPVLHIALHCLHTDSLHPVLPQGVPIKIFLRTKQLFVFQTLYASKRLLVHKELT